MKRPTPEQIAGYPLDVPQVLELMQQGLTRESACLEVAKSHGQDSDYVDRLMGHYLIAKFGGH